jgi:hypothetical protein
MVSTPVAIVVSQNAQSLDISGPLDAFLEANRQAPSRCNYDVRLLSMETCPQFYEGSARQRKGRKWRPCRCAIRADTSVSLLVCKIT